MKLELITKGKRVKWTSKTKEGRGVVLDIVHAKTTKGASRGQFVHVKSDVHPKGFVAVRPTQISSAK